LPSRTSLNHDMLVNLSRNVLAMLMSRIGSLTVEALVKLTGPFIRGFLNAFFDAETIHGIA